MYNNSDSVCIIPRWESEISANSNDVYKPDSGDTQEYKVRVTVNYGFLNDKEHWAENLKDNGQWIKVYSNGDDFSIETGIDPGKDPEHWMRDLAANIAGKTLKTVILPATHDSGSFSADMTSGVRTQTLNFKEQLERGIRFLDLRVTYSTDSPALGFKANEFYLCHDGISATNLLLIDQLNLVKDFAKSHPKEIILLNFHKFLNGIYAIPNQAKNMSDDKKKELATLVSDTFSDVLIPKGSSDVSIADIQASGKNIFILFSGNDAFDDNIKTLWDSYTSDLGATVEEKIAHMSNYFEENLKKDRSGNFLNCSTAVWSLNIRGGAKEVNPEVIDWLGKWNADEEYKKNMNIFIVDFFDEYDYVSTVINLNK
ncbi:MAG: hypothetical protein BalsKO_10100 [Balneolaceae bacterium]